MQYVQMLPEQIDAGFLDRFDRFQKVTHCWRKQENQWKLLPIAFTEQWDAEELRRTSLGLKRIAGNGAVFAAFPEGADCPAAFAAVEGEPSLGARVPPPRAAPGLDVAVLGAHAPLLEAAAPPGTSPLRA